MFTRDQARKATDLQPKMTEEAGRMLHTLQVWELFKTSSKASWYFLQDTKHNVHRFTLNLQGLKIMIVESFIADITYWGAVVFEKWITGSGHYL